jgi:hypothetical protein
MVERGPGAHALVVWRYALKPRQERQIAPEAQSTLFGDEFAVGTPVKQLRVWWSTKTQGVQAGFVPKHKSVGDNSLISLAYTTDLLQSGMECLDLGPVQGLCCVEAKRVTVGSDVCVVSLLHLPQERNCRTLQSQLNL